MSSAYFVSSNGMTERSLKSLKILMKKRHYEGSNGLDEAVDILNAAPVTESGMSAARLFFGRPLRQPKLTLLLDNGLKESQRLDGRLRRGSGRSRQRNDSISRKTSLVLKAGDRVRMQSRKSRTLGSSGRHY